MAKRFAFALLIIAATASRSSGQEVALEVKGDVQTVTIVKSLPFTIQAPPSAGLYFWSFSPTIQAIDKGDKLEVIAAPKGAHTISVKLILADWDAKKFITKFGSTTFTVGEPGPAPTPPVPPGPQTDLEKAVKAAWDAEPNKSAYSLAVLAQIHKQAAQKEVYDQALKTFGELYLRLSKAGESLLGKTTLAGLRLVIAEHLKRTLPVEPSAPLHTDARRIAAAQFSDVAAALEKLR